MIENSTPVQMTRFEHGQLVAFRDRSTTRHGTIVGSELVDNPRLGRVGLNFMLKTVDGDYVRCHEADVGAIVGEIIAC